MAKQRFFKVTIPPRRLSAETRARLPSPKRQTMTRSYPVRSCTPRVTASNNPCRDLEDRIKSKIIRTRVGVCSATVGTI